MLNFEALRLYRINYPNESDAVSLLIDKLLYDAVINKLEKTEVKKMDSALISLAQEVIDALSSNEGREEAIEVKYKGGITKSNVNKLGQRPNL